MKPEKPRLANFAFRAEGNAFEEGIPFPLMCALLEDVQSIFDKSYLAIIGKKRMIAAERMRFHLMANEIRQGSLETFFGIAIIAHSLFPLHNIPLLWDVTLGAFQYLRDAFLRAQQGQSHTANQGMINVYGGRNTINQYFVSAADRAYPNYRDLATKIDGDGITKMSITDISKNQGIHLGSEEREIFSLSSRVEKEAIEIVCEIYDYNKFKNEGRLQVDENCHIIPPGNYKFQVIGLPSTIEYVLAMLKNRVTLRCFKVVEEKNPLGAKHRIAMILVEHIIDKNPNKDLFL